MKAFLFLGLILLGMRLSSGLLKNGSVELSCEDYQEGEDASCIQDTTVHCFQDFAVVGTCLARRELCLNGHTYIGIC